MRGRSYWLLVIGSWCLVSGGVVRGDIWPSWLSPMQGGFDRGNQCLSGAVERLTVVAGPDAWKTYATTNIWGDYFKQRTKIVAAKNILGAAVDNANGKFVFPDSGYTPASGVIVTRTGLTARIGVGPEWWTNTPAFNVAVETNGFRFMPAALSNLVWVAYRSQENDNDYYNVFATNLLARACNGSGTNKEAAIADGELAWASATIYTNSTAIGYPSDSYLIYSTNGGFVVYMHKVIGDRFWSAWRYDANAAAQDYNTILKDSVKQLWFTAHVQPTLVGRAVLFNDQGDTVATNPTTPLIEWTHYAGVTNGAPAQLGQVSIDVAPTGCGDVGDAYYGWSTRWGESAYPWTTLHKFNPAGLTNGFKWFK